MDLYVIRHAEAAPLGENGVTEDSQRPLTAAGHDQAKTLAAGLPARGVRPDVFISSPLLRARQTAEDILQHWPDKTPLRICEELAPGGKRRKLARFLAELGADSVALVGHEPDLSQFIGWLIGDRKVEIALAKAGVAFLRCADKPGKGCARLEWLVPPEWIG